MGFRSLICNSAYASNKNRPKFVLKQPEYINKFKLLSFECPLSFDIVTSTTNTFYFIETDSSSTTRSVTIPVGSYTSTSICSTLDSLLNAAGTYTYSCAFSFVTQKVTITSSSNIKILGASTCKFLGVSSSDTDFGTTQEMENILNLQGPSSLYIVCQEISSSQVIVGKEEFNIIEKIPLSGDVGTVFYYETPLSTCWVESNSTISSLSFQLLDADTLEPMTLNGASFVLKLGYSDDEADVIF